MEVIDKTFEGRMRAFQYELTQLDRRLGRVPDRLSSTGQSISDWNSALAAGFYYGVGAANQPTRNVDYVSAANHTWWSGQTIPFVDAGGALRYKQMVTRPNYGGAWEFARYSSDGVTWSAWSNIGFTEDAWTDLTSYLASGITYMADGAGDLAGIRARRVGRTAEISLGNFVIASISVPADGNTTNTAILNGIPVKFRPDTGVSMGTGWNGRIWGGYVRPNGSVYLASIMPNVTNTGTVVMTNEQLSGAASYPVSATTP